MGKKKYEHELRNIKPPTKNNDNAITETILIIIIILNIMDFFKIMPPWLDYIKKILSWTGLAIIIYNSSPTKLLIGHRNKKIDLLLITAYFSMIVKNLVSFAIVARNQMIQNYQELITYLQIRTITPTEAIGKIITIGTTDDKLNILSTPLKKMALITYKATIQPLATTLTMTANKLIIEFTTTTQTKYALLQATGLNGTILQFYNTLAEKATTINKTSFIIGITILIITAIITAKEEKIREESAIRALTRKEPKKMITKTITITIAYITFFLLIFNLVMEWLAIAVDAPLLMLGLVTYTYLYLKNLKQRRKGLNNNITEKITNFGISFYDKFIKLFKNRKTIILGLTGLLILHLLTDIANYLLPYIIGIHDVLYLGRFTNGHEPLIAYLQPYINNKTILIKETIIYALNAIGLLTILTMPAYFWYKIILTREHEAKQKAEQKAEQILETVAEGITKEPTKHPGEPRIKPLTTGIIYAAITTLIIAPAFKIKSLNPETGVVGVDIITKKATPIIGTTTTTIITAITIGIIAYMINKHKGWEKTIIPLLITNTIIIGTYAYQFFKSTTQYYLITITELIRTGGTTNQIITATMIIFLIIETLFYTTAFIGSIYETIRE